jgi:hypothetical protein
VSKLSYTLQFGAAVFLVFESFHQGTGLPQWLVLTGAFCSCFMCGVLAESSLGDDSGERGDG